MHEKRLLQLDTEEILRSVRPAVPELIARYEIPEAPAADMILASMDCLVREGHRSSDPCHFFLQLLEGYCESWVAAREAQEADEAEEFPG